LRLYTTYTVYVSPKIDENTSLGLKSSSAEKSATEKTSTTPNLTYSNFTTQDYSTNSALSTSIQAGANNTTDELKLQQLQYQQVFQKHNNHYIPRIDQLDSENNEHILLSERNTNTAPKLNLDSDVYITHKHSDNHDDEPIVDDGETSQLDLVEYASRNQRF
jgi:hypothetical protein